MSNAHPIATVTRALAKVVEDAATSSGIGRSVVASVPNRTVWTRPCSSVSLPGGGRSRAANNDLPSRSSDGTLRQRPTAALNLHYLMTFNGQDTTLDSHRMLGAVARDLHARPILSRSLIQSVSTGNLADSDLAAALDVVRVTPLSLTVEDLSKLWLMFSQIPYSLSVAYEARVVLIESIDSPVATLPVLSRGPGDRGVDTRLGPFPALDDYDITAADAPLSGPSLPSYQSAQLGLRVTLRGRNLGGDSVLIRFSHPRLGDLDITVPPSDRTSDAVRVVIPNDAPAQTAWAAGIYLVSARIANGGVTRGVQRTAATVRPGFHGNLACLTGRRRRHEPGAHADVQPADRGGAAGGTDDRRKRSSGHPFRTDGYHGVHSFQRACGE